jgi:hypothetical protein
MNARKITKNDRRNLTVANIMIDAVRRNTQLAVADERYVASEWVYQAHLTKGKLLTGHGIDRLVRLGLLERRQSDGHGPAVKKATYAYA